MKQIVTIIATLFLTSTAYANNCSKIISDYFPQLSPQKNTGAQIVKEFSDADGKWFLLNTKITIFGKIDEQLGLTRVVDGRSALPHPDTMTVRIRKFRPQAKVSFVAHKSGSLSLEEYISLIAQDKIPVGLGGQYLHDLLDHAAGYVLLSETEAWPLIKKAIEQALTKKNGNANEYFLAISKINAFLEAATTSLQRDLEIGQDEFNHSIDLYKRQANK